MHRGVWFRLDIQTVLFIPVIKFVNPGGQGIAGQARNDKKKEARDKKKEVGVSEKSKLYT